MKKATGRLIGCILAGLIVVSCLAGSAFAASENPVGDESGYIQVSCNVDDATVMLWGIDGAIYDAKTIRDGKCIFKVCTTGSPLGAVAVIREGYYPAFAAVTTPPKNILEDVFICLTPLVPNTE